MGELVVNRVLHLTDVSPTTNGYDGSARTSSGYYMAVYDVDVIIGAKDTTAAYIVYLPPAGEARGKIYTISLPVRGYSEIITLADRSDSEDFEATTLNAAHERVAYFSDGMYWYQISVTENT